MCKRALVVLLFASALVAQGGDSADLAPSRTFEVRVSSFGIEPEVQTRYSGAVRRALADNELVVVDGFATAVLDLGMFRVEEWGRVEVGVIVHVRDDQRTLLWSAVVTHPQRQWFVPDQLTIDDMAGRTAIAVARFFEGKKAGTRRTGVLDLDYLLRQTAHQSPQRRSSALGHLSRLEDPRRVEGIVRALREDHTPLVLHAALDAAGTAGDAEVLNAVTALLTHHDDSIRAHAASVLGELGDAVAADLLVHALEDPSRRVRTSAVVSLGQLDSRDAVTGAMAPLLVDQDETTRLHAALALAAGGDPQAEATLEELSRHSYYWIRRSARQALHELQLGRLDDPDPEVRGRAVSALVQARTPKVAGEMVRVLHTGTPTARQSAAAVLSAFSGEARGDDPRSWEDWWKRNRARLRAPGEMLWENAKAADRRGDLEAAHESLRLAATHGFTPAYTQLGRMYLSGEGCAVDTVEAVEWLERAAMDGDRSAQYELGQIYAEGQRAPRNLPRAWQWMAAAASLDHEQASTEAEELAGRLTSGERANAERLLEIWQSSYAQRLQAPLIPGRGGVTTPVLIHQSHVKPEYPSRARRAEVEGRVYLRAVVRTDGSVGPIQVMHSEPRGMFEKAALRAVSQWRFEPALLFDKPVEVYHAAFVDFRFKRH